MYIIFMNGLYSDQKSSKGKFLLKFIILFSKKHTYMLTHITYFTLKDYESKKKVIKFIFNAM